MRNASRLVFASTAVLTAALLPGAASAITLLPPCTATGACGVSDILAVFINLAEFLLGIMGAVALGFFIYGGFTWIMSGGSKDKVEQGITTIRNATIGIIIIFLSGVIVRYVSLALTGGASPIPIIGQTCQAGGSKTGGLYVSVPGGFQGGKPTPEEIICVAKDDCKDLNSQMEKRGRSQRYSCISTSEGGAISCVRGLCLSKGAEYACCIDADATKKAQEAATKK